MNKEELIQLADKILRKEASIEEISQYNDWFNTFHEVEDNAAIATEERKIHLYARIEEAADLPTIEKDEIIKLSPSKPWLSKTRIAAAAMILLTLSFGIYFYLDKPNTIINTKLASNDLPPGGNRATLTLADGSTINLNDDKSGIVFGDKGINYNDGTHVIPTEAEGSVRPPANTLAKESMYTLTTPKGGQYQVTLPDGTKVWLNAASTLKYPSRFNGKARQIELEGEAYFEVAHNEKQPFIVNSAGQEVTVLGTHFNINAYSDEANIKTTLIEGSVSVSKIPSPRVIPTEAEESVRSLGRQHASQSTILTPSQQSIISGNTIQLITVNTEEFIAWKDNLFLFHNSNLKSIMLQLSRWYDFNIDINNIPDAHFYGEIPKDVQLSEVLKMLTESSSLHFKLIEDGTKNKERRMIIEK